MQDSYESQMIEAFVGKPEKEMWYKLAFSTFNVNGVDVMKWKWSWWAFFGGFLYLLYRKTYLPALVLFLLTVFINFIPLGGLILMILTGGYAPYFVYKTYKTKKIEIESIVEDEEKRIETMKHSGGYNGWVIWVYVALMSMIFIFGIAAAIVIPQLNS